jgi:hypothetical protein
MGKVAKGAFHVTGQVVCMTESLCSSVSTQRPIGEKGTAPRLNWRPGRGEHRNKKIGYCLVSTPVL